MPTETAPLLRELHNMIKVGEAIADEPLQRRSPHFRDPMGGNPADNPTIMKSVISLRMLAKKARPLSQSDWGSERQTKAQDDFFDTVEKILSPEAFEELERYAMKATSDEMIDRGLEMASAVLQPRP